MANLENKVALVLGGTGSIGGAVADSLEKEGARVARHGLNSGKFQADLSQDGEAARLVKLVLEEFGGIDVVINSISAPLKLKHLKQRTWLDYQTQLNVQLRAAVEVTNEVLPIMDKAGGGVILHVITSALDEVPIYMADYLAAKGALLLFAKASQKELQPFFIKVSWVNPKFIENEFTAEWPEKAVEIMRAKGEVVTSESVAQAIKQQITNEILLSLERTSIWRKRPN